MALKTSLLDDRLNELTYFRVSGFSIAKDEKVVRITIDGFRDKAAADVGAGAYQKQVFIRNRLERKITTEPDINFDGSPILVSDGKGGQIQGVHLKDDIISMNDFDLFEARRLEIGMEQAAYEYIKLLPEFEQATDVI